MIVVSIIIPAFNRRGPLGQTLASVRRAIAHFGEPVEVIVVDDGSAPPISEQISPASHKLKIEFITQSNEGSISARQNGLRHAAGEFVLLLDSDDLIPPAKLRSQVDALRAGPFDVVYGDMATICADEIGDEPAFRAGETLDECIDPAEFFLRIQPAPHNPMYRRDFLQSHLCPPWLAADRRFDPVGDIWIYFNLAIFPARIGKVHETVAATGIHYEARFSRQWERLAVAALALMEEFDQVRPKTTLADCARTILGACAFASWRRLPRGFDRDFSERTLRIWRTGAKSSDLAAGGPMFQFVTGLVGLERAGRIFRLRNASYEAVRTCSDVEFRQLMTAAFDSGKL